MFIQNHLYNFPRFVTKFLVLLITLFSLLILSIYLQPNSLVFANELVYLSEIDVKAGGFRDLRWGRHISDCKNMVYKTHRQTSGGNVKIYKRDNDLLLLDNKITLSKIEYGFLNSRLLFVALKTTGEDNRKSLKKSVIVRFGEANNQNPRSENLFWTIENTNIIFQPDTSSSRAILLLVSKHGLTNFKN